MTTVRRTNLFRLVLVLSVVVLGQSLFLVAASAGDVSGFRYGTDTSYGTSTNNQPPWGNDYTGFMGNGTIPADMGGDMGGYMGQIGGYDEIVDDEVSGGCTEYMYGVNGTEYDRAATNLNSYSVGFGTDFYWFGGGPGADPAYYNDWVANGKGNSPPPTYTGTNAYDWGELQGEQVVEDYDGSDFAVGLLTSLFLDVEADGGWNEITDPYNPTPPIKPTCQHPLNTDACCAIALDRDVVNGFAAGVTSEGGGFFSTGIFSSFDYWNSTTFGCISTPSVCESGGHGYLTIPEWTFGTNGLSGPADPPIEDPPGQNGVSSGWCQWVSSTYTDSCANFFGGETKSSSTALIWQWSEFENVATGYTENEVGDFDQFDEANICGSDC